MQLPLKLLKLRHALLLRLLADPQKLAQPLTRRALQSFLLLCSIAIGLPPVEFVRLFVTA